MENGNGGMIGFEEYGQTVARATEPDGKCRPDSIVPILQQSVEAIYHGALSVKEGEKPLTDRWKLLEREKDDMTALLRHAKAIPAVKGRARIEILADQFFRLSKESVGSRELLDFFGGVCLVRPFLQEEIGLLVPILKVSFLCRFSRKSDGSAIETTLNALEKIEEICDEGFFRSIDPMEAAFWRDPTGIYPKMDPATKALYKSKVCRMAEKSGMGQSAMAQELLKMAQKENRHIGFFLPRKKEGREWIFRCIVGGLTALFCIVGGAITGKIGIGILLLFPVGEILKKLGEKLAIRCFPAEVVPALKETRPIDFDHRTLCVISAVLLPGEGKKLLRKIEEYALAERQTEGNLLFGLLLDLPCSDKKEQSGEREERIFLRKEIDRLNRKYGQKFYFFNRPRVYSQQQGGWIGWERKRGALCELMRLLRGKQTELRAYPPLGEKDSVRYVITLDSDTRPFPGSLNILAQAMAHPLNRPVIKNGAVTEGYGILQPDLVTDPIYGNTNRWTKILSGGRGIPPYGVGGVQLSQRLSGRTSFFGKGILDVDAYLQCLPEAVPYDKILSHDLPEGEILRCGTVHRAVFAEGVPTTVEGTFTRQNRWVRGDWQNLWWLGKNSAMPLFGRWKVLDNAWCSLRPIALLIGFLSAFFGQTFLPAAVLLTVFSDAFFSEWKRETWVRSLVRFIFLPRESFENIKAISTALWRMTVTGRNLLQWTTAAQAEKRSGEKEEPRKQKITQKDKEYLLGNAQKLWRYFEDNLDENDKYLPPDNYQERPFTGRTRRTSPTNIGFALLSCTLAVDLGLTDQKTAASLSERLLTTVESLDKWKGHLYNWIDTKTGKPVVPKIISTVDSGNLAACYLASAAAFRQWGEETLAYRAEKLFWTMDFRPLYDEKKNLFAMGWDTEQNCRCSGRYDLLESEARLAGFLAIAKGEIPVKHWHALSRPLLKKCGKTGLASWSGTMFEYLLPDLFLPVFPGSLQEMSNRFCVFCQQNNSVSGLWGISESGFGKMDEGHHYCYYGHGVQALALKQHREVRPVISPYATFLTMDIDPKKAIENLKNTEKYQVMGQYGFYEALDFSGQSKEPTIVQMTMAHHAGMSLAAIANVCMGNCIQSRLMSYPFISAFCPLLQEAGSESGKMGKIHNYFISKSGKILYNNSSTASVL